MIRCEQLLWDLPWVVTPCPAPRGVLKAHIKAHSPSSDSSRLVFLPPAVTSPPCTRIELKKNKPNPTLLVGVETRIQEVFGFIGEPNKIPMKKDLVDAFVKLKLIPDCFFHD